MNREERMEDMIQELKNLGRLDTDAGKRAALMNLALLFEQLLDSYLDYSDIVTKKIEKIGAIEIPFLSVRMLDDLKREVDDYMNHNLALLQDYLQLFSRDDIPVELWQTIYRMRCRFLDEIREGLLRNLEIKKQ